MEELIKDAKYESNETDDIIGYLMILVGSLVFVTSTYCMVIAKIFMPYTGNTILDWVKDDEHYIFLVPSMIFMTFLFAYWNWLSMKFFRHN
jgi:phosphatidylinositol glycan anchor class Y biosynthesis protein